MPRRPFICPYGWVGKRQLRKAVERQTVGAMLSNQPAPHMFFTGPPGTGKTELARIVAALMQSALHVFLPQENAESLVGLLQHVSFGDVVFIDEAHRLAKNQQHLLYSVIDNWELATRGEATEGEKQEDKPRSRVEPSTLVLATNYPGQLQVALANRLPYREHFTHYHVSELKEIVRQVAAREKHNILLTPQAVTVVAQASSGLPRDAVHHVEKLRNYMAARERSTRLREVELKDVRAYLKCYRTRVVITTEGGHQFGWALGGAELQYLEALIGARGSMSKDALSKRLGVDGERVAQMEDRLFRCGFVEKSGKGRAISFEGRAWFARPDLIYRVN